MHPNLIPIGVIMVHFATHARPCVHPMTSDDVRWESMRALCYKNLFTERQHRKKFIFIRACRSLMKCFCTDNFVINQEQKLFSRNHLLYFHYIIKELVHAFSCAYIERVTDALGKFGEHSS